MQQGAASHYFHLGQSGCQLWFRICLGGHAGAYGAGVVIDILLDNKSMNKARAFNPFLCARTDKLKALIAEVQVQMSGYEFFHQTRKRARRPADQVTYDRTVEAILCDLCAVELEPNNDSIHLPLSNKVLGAKSRYKGTALGKTLPDILKVMSAPEMDFVVLEKGHSTFKIVDDDLNVAFAGGRQTILRAGPKLLSRIERFGITRADMGHAPEEEVLVLRAPKRHSNSIAEYQEYEDDEATLALRQQMTDINAWLSLLISPAATPKWTQPNVAYAASSTTQTLHRAAGSTAGSGRPCPRMSVRSISSSRVIGVLSSTTDR